MQPSRTWIITAGSGSRENAPTIRPYKKKVEEVNSEEGLEEDEINEISQCSDRSRARILSSVEEKTLYDWSLARSEKPDRYMWPFEADITQTPTHSPLLLHHRNRRMRGRRDLLVTSGLDGWYCPSYYLLFSIDSSSSL
ncbi:NAD(P)H-quinone oxidoreductase subunit U, chloroplastic-like isoform X2 [Syzygium oleosum]|uniref:NAD(P)H-quinone oxidoreductase subunit U, chloroplastic-like isoform X2 n=1 Tax=Syzygium oleosum TaxID=219896 RepID=UPI0024BBA3D9|nr:NAD(P)H-quinone oxidoreductase subunit U, chloroplastic-like isoform X2 [Syzygium oleosum]